MFQFADMILLGRVAPPWAQKVISVHPTFDHPLYCSSKWIKNIGLNVTLSYHCFFGSQDTKYSQETMSSSSSWNWSHLYVLSCLSSHRETICPLVNGYLNAFKTFERMQCVRETIIIITNKTTPMFWRMLMSRAGIPMTQINQNQISQEIIPKSGNVVK